MFSPVIQEFMDSLARNMLAKGLRNPTAQVHIESHVAPCVYMRWGIYGQGDEGHELIRDPDISQAITDAFAFVKSLPSAEEAKRQQFMTSLGKLIDMGRENGIEVDFINPLTETMKRLSENSLTYQSTTSLPKSSWSEPKTEAEIAMSPSEIFEDIPYSPPNYYTDANLEDFDDGNITP